MKFVSKQKSEEMSWDLDLTTIKKQEIMAWKVRACWEKKFSTHHGCVKLQL